MCADQPGFTYQRRRKDTRPSAAKRGYGYKWQQYRKQFFSVPRQCACCGQPATISTADIDHIIAVTGPNDSLFWKHSNHQALLHGHHSRKTRKHNNVSPRRGGIKTS